MTMNLAVTFIKMNRNLTDVQKTLILFNKL